MGKPANTGQIHYRFQDDGSDANTSTLLGSEDTQNDNLLLDTTYFLRIKIDNTGDDPEASQVYQLQCDVDSGGYNNVTTSSSNVRAVDGSDTDGDTMGTERLTTSGTYDSTNSQYIEDGASTAFALAAGNSAELVFAIQFRSADLPGGETVSFRLLGGGATIDRYDVTPAAGMAQVELPGAGSVVLTGIVPTIEVNKDLIAGNPDALVLTGAAPSAEIDHIIGAGNPDALQITGVAPSAQVPVPIPVPAAQLHLYTGTGLRLTGQAPTVDVASASVSIEVPTGSLTIASTAPTLLTNYIRPPDVIGLVITGVAASAEIDHIRGPPVRNLAVTGQAPSVGISVSPTTRALSISSDAPSAEEIHNAVAGNPDALQISSNASTAAVGFNIQVPAGSLALNSDAGSAEEDHVASPGADDLQITGAAPAVPIVSQPSVVALVLTGLQPTLSFTWTVFPTQDTLQITGNAPSLGVTVSPSAGSLQITETTPSAEIDHFRDIPAGALAFTGNAPATGTSFTVEPGAGGLALNGVAPSVEIDHFRDVGGDSLVLTGAAPSADILGAGTSIEVPATKLNLVVRTGLQIVGQAPTIVVIPANQVPGGSLSVGSDAPSVLLRTPGAGSLTLTGQAPSLKQPGITIEVTTGTLTFTGYNFGIPATALTISSDAPTIAGFASMFAGSLTISSDAPEAQSAPIPQIPAGSLELNSDAASLDIGMPQTAGSLSISTTAPVVSQGPAVGVASLTLTGTTPTAYLKYVPAEGSLVLSSDAPGVLVDNPVKVRSPATRALAINSVAPLVNPTDQPTPSNQTFYIKAEGRIFIPRPHPRQFDPKPPHWSNRNFTKRN